jgi:CRISPR-associated endonuclease Csn1
MSDIPAVHEGLVLGLDIGTNSVGWSLIELKKKKPADIKACGVRVFQTGVNIDAKSGKNESRNVERRLARQRRRMLDRRQQRKTITARLLRRAGLLPAGNPSHGTPEWKALLGQDPYVLRAKGLDQPLTPYQFGRAIFHICQRRGFQSNRKTQPKKDERGVVKEATSRLEAEMTAAGARTLGEYLNSLNPHEQRRRDRYTLRAWYRKEFNALWDAQAANEALKLDDSLRRDVERAIFYQRPLKKQKAHLLGYCELEKAAHKPRAALALLSTQRFRLLQDLNHTMVVSESGRARALTPSERALLLAELERCTAFKFSKAKKLLKLQRGDCFNMEEGGREAFQGDSTAAGIRSVLGERWDAADAHAKAQLVEDLMSIENPEALERRVKRVWQLDDVDAEALSDVSPEDGHASLSTKAINKILPFLEAGLSYAEARDKAYPERAEPPSVDKLPALENLRNPMVQRSLAEVRHVVNALVAEYGKPGRIRIELARDLKQNARKREETWQDMRRREKDRQRVAERIVKEAGLTQPKRSDIEKALLFEECEGTCPYTGQGISFRDLFGDSPRFDVEHIIPFSRSLDDSYANKTLCEVGENRSHKRNRTPCEAYGQTDRWKDILGRVRGFSGTYAREKLRRFMIEEVAGEDGFVEDFSSKQLNDTRYASLRARDFLAHLYPAAERKKRMQVSAGRTTAYLRSAWKLNGLLSDGDFKSRDDHRHHALDAVVVALTEPAVTKALATAAGQARRPGVFDRMPEPMPNFVEKVRKALEPIVVSHRVSRRLNGPLHEDTIYGLIKVEGTNCKAVIRKRLDALSDADIKKNAIVDKAVREAVHAKLAELGLPPAKAFQDVANRPCLKLKSGRLVRIRRVRIFKNELPERIGAEPGRLIIPGNNHHMEVFSVNDRKGNPTWRCEVISLLDAKGRQKLGQPVVRSEDEQGNKLVFSLAIGDAVQMEWQGHQVVAVVLKLSDRDYCFRQHTDARLVGALGDDLIRITSESALFRSKCRKVSVDALGRTHACHD